MNQQPIDQWAKRALTVLVDHVKSYSGGPKWITYGELARRMKFPEPHTGNLFANQIGKVLGAMGHLFDGRVIGDQGIPPIQSLVVSASKKLPSDGLKEFFPSYPQLSIEKKRDFVSNLYPAIFEFGSRWERLLAELGLTPDHPATEQHPRMGYNPWGGEGSPEHRALRDYIAGNPGILGIPSGNCSAVTEFPIKSGDRIDVVFQLPGEIIAVEVKSRRSGPDDFMRGVFQCIKYASVLAAECTLRREATRIRAILVIEGKLDGISRDAATRLSVSVIETVTVPNNALQPTRAEGANSARS